ncbi:amidohydrolase family protein [Noviherbaspirillum galbum]|uniref:Amidohydrolase n=1 Tax=Noviherbaspirillum galbum TaxID=2709383 RepID=A0A6B3SVD3_9BURK|nr:amidohydrolase family protein [Noviherbaspirillum galbum]NEX64697.1 amidohydrolase [Noviherbaspirillum galbum]
MNRIPKVAIEEHFSAPGFHAYSADLVRGLPAEFLANLAAKLTDFDEQRLEAMDAGNIEYAILSQTTPGVQAEADTSVAISRARENNDFLAARIARHPTRFGAFAHVAMQDPVAAARELERSVVEYGFKGALINGHTRGRYYEGREFDVFWERAEALGVPVYLHPTAFSQTPALLDGMPVLQGASWGWGVETAGHALRLLFGGVFDRFPKLVLLLGHMGEFLPYQRWRIDSRFAACPMGIELKRKPSEYIGSNIMITTAGVCSAPSLLGAIGEIGPEAVLFSVDYPYESTAEACSFIEQAPLDEKARALVCHGNARRIFKIGNRDELALLQC